MGAVLEPALPEQHALVDRQQLGTGSRGHAHAYGIHVARARAMS